MQTEEKEFLEPPLIPWWTPVVPLTESLALLKNVIERGFPNEGVLTRQWERALEQFCGVEHVVATTSGTASISLSLLALGVGPGDEVLVPDMTFIATANAVQMVGAIPVLVDIESETLGMDPRKAEEAITSRTKAMVPVHISGRACKIGELLMLAKAHGLSIVEDSAECLGSFHKGKHLGTLGSAGILSFSSNKTISSGQGGAVLTSDPRLAQRLRELKDQGRPIRGTGGNDDHPTLGFNFKYTDLQASIALSSFGDLSQRLERQRKTYKIYEARLGHLRGIRVMPFQTAAGECPQWVDALSPHRDRLCAKLEGSGFQIRKFWKPLHAQPPYRDASFVGNRSFVESSLCSEQAFWLPTSLTITDEQVERVCRLIESELA